MSFFEELRTGDPKGKAVKMITDEDWPNKPNALVDLDGGMSVAARQGQFELVKLMHATMKERKQRVKSYNWAIDTAAQAGAAKIVEWLMAEAVKDGVKVDVELPLWSAAYGGHLGLVKQFYAMGARNVNHALFQAAWMGRLDVILFLVLQCNADNWAPALRLFTSAEVLRQLWDHNSNLFVHFKLVRPPSCPPQPPPYLASPTPASSLPRPISPTNAPSTQPTGSST